KSGCNDASRALLENGVEHGLDGGLIRRIERARGFVKNQNSWIFQESLCNGQPLAFAVGKPVSTVPNNALIAARQRCDGLVNLGQPCRDFNVAFRCVRPSISHIVQYAGVKQIRLLRHQANMGAKGFELDVPEIVTVDQYPAGAWIVDAKQQACQRALAAPEGPTIPTRFPGRIEKQISRITGWSSDMNKDTCSKSILPSTCDNGTA